MQHKDKQERTRAETHTLSPELGTQEWHFAYAVAMKIVKNEVDAEDVAQDALLLAHRHRDSFRGQSKYSTWLYRVVTTSALMHLRSKGRKSRERCESALSDGEKHLVATLECEAADPEVRALCREELAEVQACIRELGAKYQELLQLRWFEGYSEREVASRLDLPLTTVKTRAFRGRQRLLERRALAA